MTRTSKMLIPAVVAIAAVAAYWFLAIAPKREEIAKLDKEISTQESKAAQAEDLVASYEKAKANYRKNYTMVARLGKAVPADDDVRSLLIQLDSAAKQSKVSFRSLNVEGGGAAPTEEKGATTSGALAPPPGAVPVGSAGFSAMPFKFAFSGSFFRLSDFFQRLERFVTVQNNKIDVTGRLLLGGISVTPQAGDLGKLDAEISAATYLVPPTEGVTAGATPSGPADAGAAPADDAGTVSTTTATITGVR